MPPALRSEGRSQDRTTFLGAALCPLHAGDGGGVRQAVRGFGPGSPARFPLAPQAAALPDLLLPGAGLAPSRGRMEDARDLDVRQRLQSLRVSRPSGPSGVGPGPVAPAGGPPR